MRVSRPHCESLKPVFRGHVTQVSKLRGPLFDGHNLIADVAVEVVALALIGKDALDGILFGDTGGQPATPGLRSIFNPISRSLLTAVPPYVSRDREGFSTIVTLTGQITNSDVADLHYDMLGLVSANDRLFAALSFPAVTVAPGDTVSVTWNIFTNGAT